MARLKALLGAESPALLALSQLVVSIIGLVTAPILARALGAEGRGEAAAALVAFMFVPIVLSLGVPWEVRRATARRDSGDSLAAARVIAVCCLPLSTALAWPLTRLIFGSLTAPEQLACMAGVAAAPLTMTWLSDISWFVASGRFRAIFAVRVMFPLVNLTALSFLCACGSITTTTALWAAIGSRAATSVVSILLTGSRARAALRDSLALLLRARRMAGGALAEAANARLDQLLLLPLAGGVAAGFYAVALTFSMVPVALAQSFAGSYFTKVASTGSDFERDRLVRAALRETLVVVSAAAASLAIFAAWAVSLVFGNEFGSARDAVWVSLLGSVLLAEGFVASNLLAAVDRGWAMTIAQVTALAADLVLLVALAPSFGAVGAAWASVASYGILLGISLAALHLWPTALLPRRSDARGAARSMFRL